MRTSGHDQIDAYSPLREGAVVDVGDSDTVTADVVVVGSGMGGSTLAWALRDRDVDVLVVERGRFLPPRGGELAGRGNVPHGPVQDRGTVVRRQQW